MNQQGLASAYHLCRECGRQIVSSLFDTATSHAPGCRHRRSLLAKAAARERKVKAARLAERAAKRATSR